MSRIFGSLSRKRPAWLRSIGRTSAICGLLLAGTVGVAAVGGKVGAWLAEQRDDTSTTARTALESEIDAMIDAGIPADDQKVQMLEQELAALRTLEAADPVPEPDVDLDAVARGSQRDAAPGLPDPTEEWEDGPVECEPIPQRLSAEDVEGATCFVEPLTGGGARYVAVTPDGTEHEVLFGT